MLLVSPGVGGVGATVYVVVILQAVLGRSHHVRRFHRGPENRGKLFNNAVKSRKWPQDISTQVSMVTVTCNMMQLQNHHRGLKTNKKNYMTKNTFLKLYLLKLMCISKTLSYCPCNIFVLAIDNF